MDGSVKSCTILPAQYCQTDYPCYRLAAMSLPSKMITRQNIEYCLRLIYHKTFITSIHKNNGCVLAVITTFSYYGLNIRTGWYVLIRLHRSVDHISSN